LTREFQFDKARKWVTDRVDSSGGPDACHPWTAGRFGTGYGAARLGGRQMGSHRAVWILAHGPIPKGLVLCHRCDNPICCNVAHLFLGTHADNIADKVSKHRHPHGETNGRAVLTEEQVRYIREHAGPRNKAALGRRFGVSAVLVGLVARGKIWKHVTSGAEAGSGAGG